MDLVTLLGWFIDTAYTLVGRFATVPILQAQPISPGAFEIIPILEKVYNQMKTGQLGSGGIIARIEVLVRAVAGIGALLYIFSRLIGQISRNESIDFFPLLRPFAMMILIALAPKLCDGMDRIGLLLLNTGIADKDQISVKVAEHFQLMEEKAAAKEQKQQNDPNAVEPGLWDSIKDATSATYNYLSNLIPKLFVLFLHFIQVLLEALFLVANAIFYLFSISYRLILRMAAPLVFVVAIFPGFTNNMLNWFGKYINFTLLPFVSAIYGSLAFTVLNSFLSVYDSGAFTTTPAEYTQVGLFGVAYIGLLIMCIIGYFQVPSMTEMLVSVGGVGALAQGASNALTRSKNLAGGGLRQLGKIGDSAGNLLGAGTAAVTGAAGRSFGGVSFGGATGSPNASAGNSANVNSPSVGTTGAFMGNGSPAPRGTNGSAAPPTAAPNGFGAGNGNGYSNGNGFGTTSDSGNGPSPGASLGGGATSKNQPPVASTPSNDRGTTGGVAGATVVPATGSATPPSFSTGAMPGNGTGGSSDASSGPGGGGSPASPETAASPSSTGETPSLPSSSALPGVASSTGTGDASVPSATPSLGSRIGQAAANIIPEPIRQGAQAGAAKGELGGMLLASRMPLGQQTDNAINMGGDIGKVGGGVVGAVAGAASGLKSVASSGARFGAQIGGQAADLVGMQTYQGTMARNIPKAINQGAAVGESAGRVVGGAAASFIPGAAATYAANVGGFVGKIAGGVMGGAAQTAGEVARFGANVIGGTVANYQAATHRNAQTGQRDPKPMPMTYATANRMNDNARRADQAPPVD